MNEVVIEPNCRYGHGPLSRIAKQRNQNVNFGFVMYFEGAMEPGSFHGLQLWVCQKCGYMECIDDDAAATMKHMESPQ